MKLTIDRKAFADALAVLAKACEPSKSKQARPILKAVCLRAGNGYMTARTTDISVSATYATSADVTEDGACVVNAANLAAYVAAGTDERLTMETNGDALVCFLNAGRQTFGTFPAADFPRDDVAALGDRIEVDPRTFRDMLKRTAFAAAKERGRFAFHGVRLNVKADEFRMVATDGKRLATLGSKIEAATFEAGHIVPTRALAIMGAASRVKGGGTLRLTFSGAHVFAETNAGLTVQARVVEGAFPRYEAVLEQRNPFRVTLNRSAFLEALNVAESFASPEVGAVRFTFADGRLTFSTSWADGGDATCEVPATFAGSYATAFNVGFVAEGLTALQGETVTLTCGKPDESTQLHGDDAYVYVVMPVTIVQPKARKVAVPV